MGAPEPIYHSADMIRELNAREPRHTPRYETVRGELLVTVNAPRPLHQRVVSRLVVELGLYLRSSPVGEVLAAPCDVSWGLPDVLVQPDVFVVPAAAARRLAEDGWRAVDRLLLAVEVLSPASARHDRFTKRRLYQERGTPLYWVVDADAGIVEAWTPDDAFPRVERERLHWQPEDATAPFTLTLDALFGG